MNPKRLKSYFFIIIAMAIWGIAGPVVKFTLDGIDPFSFLSYRFTIAAVIAIFYIIIKKPRLPKNRKVLLMLIVYGLLSTTVSLGFLFVGLESSTVLDLVLISTVGPLIMTAAGAIFLKEHITHREKIGTSIALAGTILAVMGPIVTEGVSAKLTGNIFLILAMVVDIAAIILVKKLLRVRVSSSMITHSSFLIGAFTMVPIAFFTLGAENVINSVLTLEPKYQLGVFYMAIVSGSVGYYFRTIGQKTIEVSEAGLFAYLQPIFGAPLAVLWLGEAITPLFIIGATIISAGVVIAEYKVKR